MTREHDHGARHGDGSTADRTRRLPLNFLTTTEG
jgi:hypothetical protein